jgi:hypothetical protein
MENLWFLQHRNLEGEAYLVYLLISKDSGLGMWLNVDSEKLIFIHLSVLIHSFSPLTVCKIP